MVDRCVVGSGNGGDASNEHEISIRSVNLLRDSVPHEHQAVHVTICKG